MNVVSIAPKAPAGLAKALRDLADKVDRHEVTDVIAAFLDNDNYEFWYDASKINCIAMSAMLHTNCIDRMRT